jgi:thiamine-phosphate pyrophosphorylase
MAGPGEKTIEELIAEGEGFDDANALDPEFADRFDRDPRRPPCQLYLISPPRIDERFADRLAAVLDTGLVAAFQLRVKDIADAELIELGRPLRVLCAAHDTAFIVNDSVEIAKALDADGVHLGQDDGDPRDARRTLGPDAQIGVTCHGSRHLAMEAGEAGADYVAFGAFYPTTTKLVSHHADLSLLGWWSTIFELPCVAIGGITADNARPLIEAGADFIAVSGAVWESGDPVAAVRRFAPLLG